MALVHLDEKTTVEVDLSQVALRGTPIDASELELLRAAVSERAAVLTKESGAPYHAARKIWNNDFDRYPAVIVQVTGVSDVIQAVKFASKMGLKVSMKGGGHSLSGSSLIDGGLLIDGSNLRGVDIDLRDKTATVHMGTTLGDCDRETCAFGLMVPGLGTAPPTGVIGLTLGGGVGHASRLWGAAVDHLVRLSVVLADGTYVHASATENPDIFWLATGSGGGFGVVTSMTFKLQPVPSPVSQYQLALPTSVETAQRFAKLLIERDQDRAFTAIMSLTELPLPSGPTEALMISTTGLGKTVDELKEILAPLKEGITPLLERSIPWESYFHLQNNAMSAATVLGDSKGVYSKMVFVAAETFAEESIIKRMIEHFRERPKIEGSCAIILGTLGAGGAICDVPVGKTSYFARTSNALIALDSKYLLEDRDVAHAWVRSVNEKLLSGIPQESYVNAQSEDFAIEGDLSLQNRVKTLRAKYDPNGLFNQAVAARFKE